MSLSEHYNFGIIVSLFDISKFFDRENIHDVLGEAYRCGIKGKLYRLLYLMNKDTIIKVKIPLGDTEEAEVGEILGQGTIEGAPLSAASLDKGATDFFEDHNEINYGAVNIKPLLFQDDVMSMSLSLENAQLTNYRMEAILETKLLDFNLGKYVFIVLGDKKFKKTINEQLEET